MKPFDVICIKPFNLKDETDAWGFLELLKIYTVESLEIFNGKIKPGKFIISGVKAFNKEFNGRNFFVTTHRKFESDGTVPVFREHLKKL